VTGARVALVVAERGDLFAVYWSDLWTTRLARLTGGDGSSFTAVAEVPNGVDEMLFVDDWVLLSVGSGSCGNPNHRLVALSTTASPSQVVPLADGLAAPPVMGPAGLTFVDQDGRLLAASIDDVRAALATAK